MTTHAQQAISSIREKAQSAGFRLSDVCRVAEIDQAQVSRWSSGVTEPLYGSVRRLEEAVDALVAARLKSLSEAIDGVWGDAVITDPTNGITKARKGGFSELLP